MPGSNPDELKPIVIAGPTGSGKTGLANEIARLCGAEIISADSRQVYKHLSAGTAKPKGSWKGSSYISEGIPYHLVDFLDPKVTYNAGAFVTDAKAAFAQITSNNRRAVFAGGTGLYIQAYWNGLNQLPKADAGLRKHFEDIAKSAGPQALHERLRQIDGPAAEAIPSGNVQRVIRALEVHELTGLPISSQWTKEFFGALPVHLAVFAVLDWPKSILHERISSRIHAVFEEMVEETERLIDAGYPQDCPGLKSIGYPQVIDLLEGRISKTEAVHKIISLTLSYAKRQTTWFRRYKNARRIPLENFSDRDIRRVAKDLLGMADAKREPA